MAGCSHTNDPSSVPDAGTASQTEMPSEIQTETNAAEETTTAVSEIVAESTETTMATSAAEPATSAETSQTASTDETSAGTQTEETQNVSRNAADLIGKWQFPDGYCLNFLAGNTVELSIDFSYDLKFTDGLVQYLENSYPYRVEGDTVKATGNGTTILEMTAMEGADAQNLSGRFRLGACQVYIDQVIDHTEQTKIYYIDLKGSKINLVMPSAYRAEEGVLTMIDEGSEMIFDFVIRENELIITDQDGYTDVLTRVG